VHRLAALLFVATATADAKPPPPRSHAAPDIDRSVWRDLVEPHAHEVRAILATARQILSQSESLMMGDYDRQQIDRYLVDVYTHLRYAHKLAPENVEVLGLLGQVADELGKTRQAIDALESAIALVGADRANVAMTGRLGAIYLRLGRVDDALRYLRLAQGPLTAGNAATAHALIHLSNALAQRDRMDEAIDVLAESVATPTMYPSNESTLVAFALAVQLDRDEQRGAAFDVLDRLQGQLQGTLAAQVQQVMATMRFAPAEDEHYYRALLYEVAGNYCEARAEWSLYAASDGKWRSRALAHITEIDRDRRAPPAKPGKLPIVLRMVP
jgi:tetratricopeptide (TPR) repeat protein